MSRNTTHEYHVSESTLPIDVPAETVISQLRDSRVSGELKFHFIDGGLRSVTLTKRTKLNEERRPQPRRIASIR